MSSFEMAKYLVFGTLGLFVVIAIAFLIIRKFTNKADAKYAKMLTEGTKTNTFSMDVLYQKLYIHYAKIPFIKTYLIKIRRRLEIINLDDEYITRLQASAIMTKALGIVIPLSVLIMIICRNNVLLMLILLLFELFMIESIIEGMVDKIDNKLLKQQVDFFAEIRHAYHESNMVEEAIYQVSQDDELEVSRQAEKIYEVLISDDPEGELEKYYDIAPNSYLKEFAGVSYLTKEFGDRQVNGASLYLKNLNNITQEMQIEILKRDKMDYKFQSLSIISAVPILFLEPCKAWAVSQFAFTNSFYSGKAGMIVQCLILVLTYVCYLLVRRVKDSSARQYVTTDNPWQAKLYKKPIVKKVVDLFIPKKKTKDYRKLIKLLKDAASKQKVEWLYINKLVYSVIVFVVSIFMFNQLHMQAVEYIYSNPTTDYNILGKMSEADEKKAMTKTEQDNYFLDMFKNKIGVTQQEIRNKMERTPEYFEDATDEELDTASSRVYTKLQIINKEVLQWFEMLLAVIFAVIGYKAPTWLLFFQMKMRQMEMEDEVMQFQTIILMLMKIERVNVEIILEWLERYSNIFREPISRCVNNYESGAWEALETFKNDITYMPLIRIVESLQASVEKIPIKDAFDELETERDYYQEKRKDSNERLISRKSLIGQVIGFAPMVCLFVGYLIIPLVVIGMMSMTSSFQTMSSKM